MASKWQLDFKASPSTALKPYGFTSKAVQDTQDAEGDSSRETIKNKMAWAVATGPLKSVPQNLFMMWMMGSSISIFTIGFLVYMLYGPVKALLSVNTAFTNLKESASDRFVLQKLMFMASHLALLGLGAWKCSGMGLLPSSQADWLEFVVIPEPLERSIGGLL